MIELIPAASYRRMVWKNGLGVTEEIAVSPPGATLASGFLYRISRAQVTAGGPFSQFPGCDRILTVIEGEGLSLTRGAETTALTPFAPFGFSGDDPISAKLDHGPITDFNVIFDRTRLDASCELLSFDDGPPDLRAGTEHILHCVRGSLVCEGVTLEEGDSARAIFEPGSQPKVLRQTVSTIVLHVRLPAR